MTSARTSFICAQCVKSMKTQRVQQSTRAFSTTPNVSQSAASAYGRNEEQPRWRQTPARMRMPVRTRPRPDQPEWKVNTAQEPLDEMYDRFIGSIARLQGQSAKGRDFLDEEVKWVAITHKSFEHGKQGFNDRLAFLGKRILDLQTSLALLQAPPSPTLTPQSSRLIFKHPALDGVENITPFAKSQALSPPRLAQLAATYGLDKVVRWKPRKSDNLATSGMDVVLAHTMCSIIGALALQKGGDVAVRVAKERVLAPLGLR